MKKPWWQTDTFETDVPLPPAFDELSGPQGPGLVKVWGDGRTDQGWGLIGPQGDPSTGFMSRYPNGEFNARRVLYGFLKGKWAFALIMRSVRVICIDIDGKNGGFEHTKELGMLPPTLAETSKSGNGYHLFYLHDETWTDYKGFGALADRIGIVQGVDIRATGCVFHYPQQRWNNRDIAPLPEHLKELLAHREQKIEATNQRILKTLTDADPMEVLMMHDEMIRDLAKPIPAGKRNQTLFALGSQMQTAQVDDWEVKLRARADEVGLDAPEIEKLVSNITRYAPATP